jgi:hypothetical protein
MVLTPRKVTLSGEDSSKAAIVVDVIQSMLYNAGLVCCQIGFSPAIILDVVISRSPFVICTLVRPMIVII